MEIKNKRVRAEVAKHLFLDARVSTKDNETVFDFDHGTVTCSPCYPFDPPTLKVKTRVHLQLDPCLWAITILANPHLYLCAPTWNVACMCCKSLTCKGNWTIQNTIRDVANESEFHAYYAAVHDLCNSKTRFFQLPHDLLEYMVQIARMN